MEADIKVGRWEKRGDSDIWDLYLYYHNPYNYLAACIALADNGKYYLMDPEFLREDDHSGFHTLNKCQDYCEMKYRKWLDEVSLQLTVTQMDRNFEFQSQLGRIKNHDNK